MSFSIRLIAELLGNFLGSRINKEVPVFCQQGVCKSWSGRFPDRHHNRILAATISADNSFICFKISKGTRDNKRFTLCQWFRRALWQNSEIVATEVN